MKCVSVICDLIFLSVFCDLIFLSVFCDHILLLVICDLILSSEARKGALAAGRHAQQG